MWNPTTKTIFVSLHKVLDAVNFIIISIDKTLNSFTLKEEGDIFWGTDQCPLTVDDDSHLRAQKCEERRGEEEEEEEEEKKKNKGPSSTQKTRDDKEVTQKHQPKT
jgi:hypothetical protein